MNSTYRRSAALLGLALALGLLMPAGALAQANFARIVVFGTSLSDPGNAFALNRASSTPPYDTLDALLVPGAPYAKGGHHFTNGATWVEQFARPLGLAGDTRPAFQGPGTEATNYAVGAARAREDGVNANLSFQVGAFLNAFNGAAPPDGLYVIEMGGNDVRDALVAYASGGDGAAVLEGALEAIAFNIGRLYAAGARQFLVWNVPDIGLTPAVRMSDPSGVAAVFASFLAATFNSELDGVLGLLQGACPGIQITKLDVFLIIHQLHAQPAAFDLGEVDTACITPGTPPFECKVPDQYLFWDGIHPTKAVHAIVAQDAAIALALK